MEWQASQWGGRKGNLRRREGARENEPTFRVSTSSSSSAILLASSNDDEDKPTTDAVGSCTSLNGWVTAASCTTASRLSGLLPGPPGAGSDLCLFVKSGHRERLVYGCLK